MSWCRTGTHGPARRSPAPWVPGKPLVAAEEGHRSTAAGHGTQVPARPAGWASARSLAAEVVVVVVEVVAELGTAAAVAAAETAAPEVAVGTVAAVVFGHDTVVVAAIAAPALGMIDEEELAGNR